MPKVEWRRQALGDKGPSDVSAVDLRQTERLHKVAFVCSLRPSFAGTSYQLTLNGCCLLDQVFESCCRLQAQLIASVTHRIESILRVEAHQLGSGRLSTQLDRVPSVIVKSERFSVCDPPLNFYPAATAARSIGLEKPGRLRMDSGLNEHLGRHETAKGPLRSLGSVKLPSAFGCLSTTFPSTNLQRSPPSA